MQSTVSIFRHLCDNLPPLFPAELKEKMIHALNHLEHDETMTVESLEDTMIRFGYEVWPWNQSYREFLALSESDVGDHFLAPRLSGELRKKFSEFKAKGGTWRDLHSGSLSGFFNLEERTLLCELLCETQAELHRFTNSKVTGAERNHYLKRVEEFRLILEKVRDTLNYLRKLADEEQDHPSLANEIRERVRSFEHGMCSLGPDLEYRAVCESVDFFHGRKHELNRFRGMHLPKKFSWEDG